MMRFSLVFWLLLGVVIETHGQEWTRFRGPNGTGLSAAATIPSTWTETDFNWKLPLPGPGHSSPVLWGDRIFFLTGDEHTNQVWVFCVNAGSGRVNWQKSLPLTAYRRHAFNSAASSTPAVDQDRVYVCWSMPERFTLKAFNHQGAPVWEKDLGPFVSQHGGGVSPIVCQEKVVLANQQDGESFLLAVDAATGETRWKTPRKKTEAAYSTPFLYEPPGGKPALIFTSHSHGISAVDPGLGRVLWEVADVFDKRVVSSPLLADGLIIGACGSGEGGVFLIAARPGDLAAGKQPELAYTIRRSAPYVPTSIYVGDLLFLWNDDGVVTCVRAATGEVKWQERLGKHFFSSPVCAGGRLFCASTTGEVVVLRASNRFELLARNALGETVHSTPAIAGGRMYIHTAKHLISIGGRTEARPTE